MHLGGRLNENQGTNKACNNVLWQAGYKTGQTVLHLSTACSIFLFFFQGSGKISSWPRSTELERTCSPIDNCQVTVPTHQVWSLDGNRCPLRDFLRSRIWMICFIDFFCGCMCASYLNGCLHLEMECSLSRGKSSVNESKLWTQQV